MNATATPQPDVVDVLTADHREVAELVAQILADPDATRRRATTDQMIAELVRHAVAEEVAAAKKVAPTRPHPAAPNSAVFHLLAGPGVGFIDRLRDRLSNRST